MVGGFALFVVLANSQVVITDPSGQEPAPVSGDDRLNKTKVKLAILDGVNQRRQSQGYEPVALNTYLSKHANRHAENMADKGELYHSNLERIDCRPTENIAAVYYQTRTYLWPNGTPTIYQSSPEVGSALVSTWMNSEGHRRNMLQTNRNEIGIGVAVGGDSNGTLVYAVQNFC